MIAPDELKRFALFAEFGEDERDVLTDLLEERELPNGKSAFREGAEAQGLVLLAEGCLKLKSKRTGEVVGLLEAPAHLGGASLFSFGKREVTALAEGHALVWTLSRAALTRLAEDSPRGAFRLAEAVAGEMAGLLRTALDSLAERGLDDAG